MKVRMLDRREHGENDRIGGTSGERAIMNGQLLEGGARRTWWEIAKTLSEKENQPMLCAQTVKDIHDRAMKKLRDGLLEQLA